MTSDYQFAKWIGSGIVVLGILACSFVSAPSPTPNTLIVTPSLTPIDIAPTASPTPIPATTIPSAASQPNPVPTQPPKQSAGDGASNWVTYRDDIAGFELMAPPGSTVEPVSDSPPRIDLPFVQGTNLQEKYLQIEVSENVSSCASSLASGSAPDTLSTEQVSAAGLMWTKQNGADAGAGNYYEWEAYSTMSATHCVSLSFVLHSTNPDNYLTPPPVFDNAQESAIFLAVVNTFKWVR